MQPQNIRYLLEQYLAGQLTAAEEQELAKRFQDAEMAQDFDFQELVQTELLSLLQQEGVQRGDEAGGAAQGEEFGAAQRDRSPMLENIFSIDKTAGTPVPSRSLLFSIRRLSVAAVVLAVIAGAVFLFTRPNSHPRQAGTVQKHTDIQPGTNRALLTLANGQQIVLNSAENGVLSQQGNTQVIKLDSGRLAYTTAGQGGGVTLYNTITTPRGGQYQVTLPDETKVWLNAESSLKFPTAFTEKERSVQLTGEAYFEVVPNKNKPFLVKAGETLTQVLGTQFNIMAYGDEGAAKTTLLEGAVRMGQGGQSTLLAPGEQGQFDSSKGRMGTRMVNTRAVVAWKDGYYYFDRASVQAVMRQIARWYDVQIVYEGAAPRDEIVGKIPRTAYVSEVLHIMELIGIHFKIEGRTITVLAV